MGDQDVKLGKGGQFGSCSRGRSPQISGLLEGLELLLLFFPSCTSIFLSLFVSISLLCVLSFLLVRFTVDLFPSLLHFLSFSYIFLLSIVFFT